MKKGGLYRCPVCGAELSVVSSVGAELRPRCCNTQMEATEHVNEVLTCSVCGCELMVIVGMGESLSPLCCNTSMQAGI